MNDNHIIRDMECSICNHLSVANVNNYIVTYPQILILKSNRMGSMKINRDQMELGDEVMARLPTGNIQIKRKLSNKVSMPMIINMEDYHMDFSPATSCRPTYEFVAFISHQGFISLGHYIAYIEKSGD